MRIVMFSAGYRIIARVFPLKYRLNFLIRSYLNSLTSIEILYYKKFKIRILPNAGNQRTISDLIFEGPRYLPEFVLVNEIKKNLPPNFVYVDVGSNIGTTVWLFADRAKRIFSFEPIPHLFETIRQSLNANSASHVSLINKAVGDSVGAIRMANNDNSNVVLDREEGAVSIDMTTLDVELASATEIDLIKVDVEGFESNVLLGAQQIIKRHKPRMLVELHPGYIKKYGSDVGTVLDFFEQRGYGIKYYSFLNSLRKSRWRQFLSRYISNYKTFKSRQEFLKDVVIKPELSSYHIYCEPQ